MQEEAIQQLTDDGFVIIKNVYSNKFLESLCKLTDDIIKHAEKDLVDPFNKYYMSHRNDQGVLYDLYQRHPEFQQLVMNKQVLDILEGVLGDSIYLYENSMIYKPKGRRNGVPWHQDFISRPTEPIKYIVWSAFDDTNEKNGALKVIPKSHSKGFRPWYRVEGETHHDRVKPEIIEQHAEEIMRVDMKAGDVLIFNMLILHSSDEVNTDIPRRAFRCSYQSAANNIFVPRGSPIIVRGGHPSGLEKTYHLKNNHAPHPIHKRIARKMGRLLNEYADR